MASRNVKDASGIVVAARPQLNEYDVEVWNAAAGRMDVYVAAKDPKMETFSIRVDDHVRIRIPRGSSIDRPTIFWRWQRRVVDSFRHV